MKVSTISALLDGAETIRLDAGGSNNVTLHIEGALTFASIGLVLPDYNGPDTNAAWLRNLAAQAMALADAAEARGIEQAS
jgi:hypothetical protein